MLSLVAISVTETHKSCQKEKRESKHKDKKIQENEKFEVFFSLLEFEKNFTLASYKLQSKAMYIVLCSSKYLGGRREVEVPGGKSIPISS